MKTPVYLDYAATTPVDPRVVEAMLPWLGGRFGNPASSHAFGRDAELAVVAAARQVAGLIGATPDEIVWTSGATEANNLAIFGAARAARDGRKHLVTLVTEHRAVLDPIAQLVREGFGATVLDVKADGLVDPAVFRAALRPDTLRASVMLVNNEIGVIQPISELAAIARERGVLFHCDAAQAPGKLPIDVRALGIDLMTLTAHKTYGPTGIGVLYVRSKPRVPIAAQIVGGGQQHGRRSGTLPVHQIVGIGEAFRIAGEEGAAEAARVRALRDTLRDRLCGIPGVHANGSFEHRIAHNLNISVERAGGEALIAALSDLAISTGSACSAAHAEPSHVIRALGRSVELADASLRITLGRWTTREDVEFASGRIAEAIARRRQDLYQ